LKSVAGVRARRNPPTQKAEDSNSLYLCFPRVFGFFPKMYSRAEHEMSAGDSPQELSFSNDRYILFS
jgi:hypothetical protein